MSPMISVCTPYWNQQEHLDRMVTMYHRLYEDYRFEFSVCDDGSPQPAEHPECLITRLPAKDRPLNPCVPVNRAVEASSGDIIVLTKPKVVHDVPVLPEMLSMLRHEDDYVTARCYGVGYPGVRRLALAGPDVDYATRGRLPVPDGAHFHFLAAFHRSLWDKAGGFDEDFREVQGCDDNDWLWRLHRVGTRFRCAEGTVWQPRSETRWGLPHGKHVFARKWPEAMQGAA